MPLTLNQVQVMAITAAAGTTPEPRKMDGQCMAIAQAVVAAMPAPVPAPVNPVVVGYVAMRWHTPNGVNRSHVAAYVSDGADSFVIDAAWQQYPFMDRLLKYRTAGHKHVGLGLAAQTTQANAKEVNPATRVFVGTLDQWQAMVETLNNTAGSAIARRVFVNQASASDWMGFRV